MMPDGVHRPRLPVERHPDVAGGGRGRRDRPVGDQPGADRRRPQAERPAPRASATSCSAARRLHNDATELCAALLVAVGMTISFLTLIIALPLATLLQRSFRHTRLLNEARADSKTGLLNSATWEREAGAEVGPRRPDLLAAGGGAARPRPVQADQRHLRAPDRRRGAAPVADTMTGVLREYDLAGRFGGEEFVMLLPQTRAPDAFKIADRVRAHIARLPISTSGGRAGAGDGLHRRRGAGRRVEQGADRAAGRGRRRALPGQGLRPQPGADDQHQPRA